MDLYDIYMQNTPILNIVKIFEPWEEQLQQVLSYKYKKWETYKDVRTIIMNDICNRLYNQFWEQIYVDFYELEDDDITKFTN